MLQAEGEEFGDYGGRGIIVCPRWHIFDNFFTDMGERPQGFSLERIDVNGNYEPENCKWIPKGEQINNRRNTLYLERDGERRTLRDWARILGVPWGRLRDRMARGLPIEKVLTTGKLI